METKTVVLALLGFGVAAYVAYQLGKGGGSIAASQDVPKSPGTGSPEPLPSNGLDGSGGNLFPGLSGMDQSVLCRLAPSLCAWSIPRPLPVVPMV